MVNQGLLALKPLIPIFIGVHPISSKKSNSEALEKVKDHLRQGGNILIYPAGKVSKLQKIESHWVLRDFPWRAGIAKAIVSDAQKVYPVFVKASNSRFFYILRALSEKVSLVFLLRELSNSVGRSFKVFYGSEIESKEFSKMTPEATVQEIRSLVYDLELKTQKKESV